MVPYIKEKTCSKCNIRKLEKEFYKVSKSSSKLMASCKSCMAKQRKEYRMNLAKRTDINIPVRKICSFCNIEKDSNEFYKNRYSVNGLESSCKNCSQKRNNINKYKWNIDKQKKLQRRRQLVNRTNLTYPNSKICSKCGVEKSKNEFYKNHSLLSGLNSSCKYCKKESRDKSKQRSKNAKYKASKLSQTPKWLTDSHKQQIQNIYKQAELLGPNYHVDHIVPLQGKYVRGLHVPWNLQILQASDNIRKNNRILYNFISNMVPSLVL